MRKVWVSREIAMLASRTATFGPRRSAVRLAVTASATLGLLFFLCWLGVRVSSLPFSHMFVQLFTAAPVAGLTALREGLFSSLAAGAAAGFFFSLFARLFDLERS
jgi:hypothetical protein